MITDNRFEKFVKQTSPDSIPEDILQESIEFVGSLKKNPAFKKELISNKALSNNIRLIIYKLIKIRPMSTCSLARILQKKDNLINHHLKILEKAGLIFGQKNGYFTVYSCVK